MIDDEAWTASTSSTVLEASIPRRSEVKGRAAGGPTRLPQQLADREGDYGEMMELYVLQRYENRFTIL